MAEKPPIPEQMYDAIQQGKTALFERLLRKHPELARYPDGRSMWLSDAASAGRLPIVQLLVRMGADVNERANADSVPSPEGVIYRAAAEGHLEVVRWLLRPVRRSSASTTIRESRERWPEIFAAAMAPTTGSCGPSPAPRHWTRCAR